MTDRGILVSYPSPDAPRAPGIEEDLVADENSTSDDSYDPFKRLLRQSPPKSHPETSPFRFQRVQGSGPVSTQVTLTRSMLPVVTEPVDTTRSWASLRTVALDEAMLARHRLTGSGLQGAAVSAAFDMLRTRALQAMNEHGWTRLLVTAPTQGCGSSFVAASLAFSFARLPTVRTVLADFELRGPALADALGIGEAGCLGDVLSGKAGFEDHLVRVADNLALAPNSTPVEGSAACLQDQRTVQALERLEVAFSPDVILFDMPAALVCDDVVAFLPQVDAVLLVVDGTQTTAADIAACEKLFEGRKPLLGVVHNRAELRNKSRYQYVDR